MTSVIYSKDNTNVLHRVVTNKVFISVQSDSEACSIIEKVEDITPAVLEDMAKQVGGSTVKVVGATSEYEKLKPTLNLVFEEVKFVPREVDFEIYFQAAPVIIRVAKVSTVDVKIQKKIKVLVVDDSKTICNLLTKVMGLSPDIEVVGAVNDPLLAEKAIEELNPDVITLDIHMPGLNGVELLKKISPKFHIPCIMISSISIQEGPLVLEALDSGAVDYIQKPDMSNFAVVAGEINSTIIAASNVVHQKVSKKAKGPATSSGIDMDDTLIVIGASTGGTKALQEVLENLPDQIPPILIVQHIPAEFSKAFADRLNEKTSFTVKEAVDGELVVPNQVLIAPGSYQMKFVTKGGMMKVEINDDAPVNRFKPSVDYLFDSVAKSRTERHIVSAIFTGMGKDGANGMKRLKEAKNCVTIAQDEETSVVFGMPKEAIKLGMVDHIVPLQDAANTLMTSCVNDRVGKAQ
jgi:two-component system chemotaxis response regulator CheB